MTPTLIATPYLTRRPHGVVRIALGAAAGWLVSGLGLGALSHGQVLRQRAQPGGSGTTRRRPGSPA